MNECYLEVPSVTDNLEVSPVFEKNNTREDE
jgi:hypothetical protein